MFAGAFSKHAGLAPVRPCALVRREQRKERTVTLESTRVTLANTRASYRPVLFLPFWHDGASGDPSAGGHAKHAQPHDARRLFKKRLAADDILRPPPRVAGREGSLRARSAVIVTAGGMVGQTKHMDAVYASAARCSTP